ncbi:MAG: hypothetical protein CMN55_15065 [Sneathiella sp.]|uniref:hypothetical protein n=1 Tax=Sneathiella sp. TaxID=1964365 RepID=UPI000C541E95|nr:hypothetical protein [Sneathiella sp.]MAL80404.1 hypothetical protein [Sneathiella sp.]
MTRIDKMDGYEIHHPFSKLQAKVKREGGLSLAEIEKRMSVRMAHLTEEFLAEIPPMINTIERMIGKLEKGDGGAEAQAEIFKQGHDLKGMGGSFDYPIMGTIGASFCELTHKTKDVSALNLPLIRVNLDLLSYVLKFRIKNESDPKAAPIIAALASATTAKR